MAPVAELRALRRMQERVTNQLDRLQKEGLPDDPDELSPLQKARLERLAHQQGTIRTMWRDFAKTVGLGEDVFEEPVEDAMQEGGEVLPEDDIHGGNDDEEETR